VAPPPGTPFHTIVDDVSGAIEILFDPPPPLPVNVTVMLKVLPELFLNTQKDPPSQFLDVGNVIALKAEFVIL
jgi:hypothetical protein